MPQSKFMAGGSVAMVFHEQLRPPTVVLFMRPQLGAKSSLVASTRAHTSYFLSWQRRFFFQAPILSFPNHTRRMTGIIISSKGIRSDFVRCVAFFGVSRCSFLCVFSLSILSSSPPQFPNSSLSFQILPSFSFVLYFLFFHPSLSRRAILGSCAHPKTKVPS